MVNDAQTGGSDLIVTKLGPPAAGLGVVERPRLTDALSAAKARRLTLVCAPLGCGKTTLLAGWCHHLASEDAVVAWLSLEDGENDPALFWRYVVGALRAAGSPVDAQVDAVLAVAGAGIHRAIGSLIDDLAGQARPTVLVLDDYHVIDNPECHQLLAWFLDRAPSDVHVVVATRSDPPLALESIRGAGQLTEIRERDLRLTTGEAAEFVRIGAGLDIDDGELALLVARTEGWAAGLRLAVLWLAGEAERGGAIREFAGDNRHVADYLAEHVLAGLDPVLEGFLLRTSILGRMCAPLCDAVTGERNAAELIAQIERGNLFLVALDGRRQWYRYHHLFAGLLQAELARREPELVRILHVRASAWHREHGTVGEAVHHAMRAYDYAGATEIITGSSLTMVRSGRSATLRRWLERFPAGELGAAPQLGYIGAFAAGLGGAPEREVQRWLRIAETALADGSDPDGRRTDGPRPFAVIVEIVRTAFVYHDVAAAAAAAQRVADLVSAGGPWRVPALAVLAFLRYLSGDAPAARAAVSEALADRDAPARPHGAVHALATKALLELDGAEPEQARRSAWRALEIASAAGLGESVTAGLAHSALGRALVAGGRRDEGLGELKLGVDCVRDRAPVAHHIYALLSLAGAELAGGDFVAAQRTADEAEGLLDGFDDGGILTTMLADVRRRSQLVRRRRRAGPTTDLSQSELAVLRLLAGQRTRAEIAAELLISSNTVKGHVASIYRKLGVHSRSEAAASAREQRLL